MFSIFSSNLYSQYSYKLETNTPLTFERDILENFLILNSQMLHYHKKFPIKLIKHFKLPFLTLNKIYYTEENSERYVRAQEG